MHNVTFSEKEKGEFSVTLKQHKAAPFVGNKCIIKVLFTTKVKTKQKTQACFENVNNWAYENHSLSLLL